ncbi:putative membrane protein [Pedobacter sp. UYP24]
MKFKQNAWIYYSITAALFWGIWGVVAKLISDNVNPFTNHFLFTIGMLFTLPFVLKKVWGVKPDVKGIIWGLIAGLLAIAGNIAVYKAFSSGGLAAIVIPVTNLYPLVTIFVAILFMKEKINIVNVIGILLAIPAVVMLSGEMLLFKDPGAFFKTIGFNTWLIYSMLALVFWGLFSAAQKVTTNYVSAEWSYISFIVSSTVLTILFFISGNVQLNFSGKTLALGTIAGMLNGLGVLASFAAYSAKGKASKVTTIAGSLQPVFTIVLAIIFLSESLNLIESIGIVLAIAAALTLSYEKKEAESQSKSLIKSE